MEKGIETLFADNYVSSYIGYPPIDMIETLKIHKGVKVAFLDTGCADHECFSSINIKRYTILENDEGIDNFGHGTFFAGVLANYCSCLGSAAPEIISIKVSKNGKVKTSDILKGIQLSISLDVEVLNIGMCNLYYNEEMAKIIKYATEKGVIVISPAGNHLNGETTFPASLETVISCASIDKQWNIAEHSNINKLVNILAPGHEIVGPLINNCSEILKARLVREGFAILDGTSFASAIVSAIAVIMKSMDINVNYKKFLSIIEGCSNKKNIVTDGVVKKVTVVNFKEMILNLNSNRMKHVKDDKSVFWKVSYSQITSNNYLIKGIAYNSSGDIVKLHDENVTLNVYEFINSNKREKRYINTIYSNTKYGCFEVKVKNLNFGLYSIEVSSANTENSIITIFNLPPEPLIEYKVDDKMILLKVKCSNKYKVYYSFGEDNISVMNGQPLNGTFLYEKETLIKKDSINKINYASFSNGVFSKLNYIYI